MNGVKESSILELNTATNFYDFDVILNEIGGLGKYQLFLISLVYWIALPAGLLYLAKMK